MGVCVCASPSVHTYVYVCTRVSVSMHVSGRMHEVAWVQVIVCPCDMT